MWTGATFTPTAKACVKATPFDPLLATAGYALISAAVSVILLLLKAWFKRHSAGVLSQLVSLASTFVVISAASIVDDAVADELLIWRTDEYLPSYLNGFLSGSLREATSAAAASPRAEDAVLPSGRWMSAAQLLPSPFALAMLWAMAVDGLSVRCISQLLIRSHRPPQEPSHGAVVQFAIKCAAVKQAPWGLQRAHRPMAERRGNPWQVSLLLRRLPVHCSGRDWLACLPPS